MSTPTRVAGDRRTDVREAAAWLGGRLTALAPRRTDLRQMARHPGRDLLAGVTVAVVALPLALAFGISSGLGASAGLVTAIVAGLVAALFGGSNLQVSGPTGAMTVVLIPIVARYGVDGVLVVGLLAGVLLIGLALLGLGRHIGLVPLPVIEGFTAGIAVLIALQQVPMALGVPATPDQVLVQVGRTVRAWLAQPAWASPALTLAVMVLILVLVRLRPGLPATLIAVVAATVVSVLAKLPVQSIGELPRSLPTPTLPRVDWSMLTTLAAPAVAVAALAALESLLSATVADAMSVAQRHDPDRELFGQGLANLASPLFGGIPATAAIARTAVNVRSGARSRLAAASHAVVLLLVVLAAAPLVALIPLPALAGVLFATAARMVERHKLRAIARTTRRDAAVLLLTLAATVLLDLATAVILGMLVAGVFALRSLAGGATVTEDPLEDLLPDAAHDAEQMALLRSRICAYRLEGPLFFAAAPSALVELSRLTDLRVVVLRMHRLSNLDATGAAALAATVRTLEQRGVVVLLSRVPTRFIGPLVASGLYGELRTRGRVFASTPSALDHARRLALA